MMKKYLVLLVCLCCVAATDAQGRELRLSPAQAETMFLEQNLQLLAERMNIDMAEAAVAQARLWDNPEVSVGDINFWHDGNMRQFSVEISQLIQTAGKRARLVGREKAGKELAVLGFEIVLLELKSGLRETVHEIAYRQSCRRALEMQEASLTRLIEACRKQFDAGNISKPELMRLQLALLELTSERNDAGIAFQELQRRLRSLLNVLPEWTIVIEQGDSIGILDDLQADRLAQIALEHRPDLKQQHAQTLFHEKSLAYERSLRIPDLTISASYDRLGGVWQNFAGAGISFDLPLLNRNQGNIRLAMAAVNRSAYLLRDRENVVMNEVVEAINNYSQAAGFYGSIAGNELFAELDAMLEVYARRLLSKDIGMLEYIDFMGSYKTNKLIIFGARRQLQQAREQLHRAVGRDL